MYRAMTQFEDQLTRKQAGKIEKKWLEMPAKNCTWATFKMFWIKAILCRKYLRLDKRAAHQASIECNNDLSSAMKTMEIVRHHNQLLAQQQHALSAQIDSICEEHNACAAPPVHDTTSDDISALTDIIGRFAAMSTVTSQTASSTISSATPPRNHRRNRGPKQFKDANGGKDNLFSSYCWKCSCNCTHWTCKCPHVTPAKCAKYRGADFDKRVDGSTKFLKRRGHYQNKFGFDSL